MPSIVEIDPLHDPRWLAFILQADNATIFHHPAWIRVLTETYRYKNVSLASVDGERLIGVLPLLEVHSWLTGIRAACLPFSDECYPLNCTPDVANNLLSYADEMRRRNHWKYIEIRGGPDYTRLLPFLNYKKHVINLHTDSEAICRTFKRTHLQHIRKAQSFGVTIEHHDGLNALDEFMRLNALTRKKLGVPPQPDRFFQNIFKNFRESHSFMIWLARYDGMVVAASLFLFFKNRMCYKYSSSDESYLKYSPNHLIVWDAVRWGCENGYTIFDFGRTDPINAGLLQYKRGWATEEIDIFYHRYPQQLIVSSKSEISLKIVKPLLKHLPVPILKIIGEALYSHAE